MSKFQNYQGTKDYLPSQYANGDKTSELYRQIENTFLNVCNTYGYDEIITPTVEFADLFKRSVGETSDVVTKEMYTFTDMGKRELVLRPEGTASVIRSYVQNKLYTNPNELVKLCYKGSMFRQESPQAGRQREFTQLGVECIGVDNPMVDAEVIALAWNFFDALGLQKVSLQINSIGCTTCRNEYKEALLNYLSNITDLCQDCQTRMIKNPLRVLDCKNQRCQEKTKQSPIMTDYLCEDCEQDFTLLQFYLQALNIPYTVNPKLVRGLDYYTKTAFEFVETSIGAQSTICGGGRYNGLVEELGGDEKAGIGFAMGLERLLIVLDNQNLISEQENALDYYLIWTNEETKIKQMQIALSLRKQGYRVEMEMGAKKMKAQFKVADRKKAKFALILGEEELKQNTLSIKDLATGTQMTKNIDVFLKEKGK